MRYFLMIAVAVLATGAFGAQGKVEGLPIKVGDSVEAVRTALGTTLKPESPRSNPESEAKELRLKSKGTWEFFDREGRTETIRLDPPFAGNFAGLKIGHSRALVVEKLGEPGKVLKGPEMLGSKPYLYYIDDLTTLRFDFDRDDKISTIYIFK